MENVSSFEATGAVEAVAVAAISRKQRKAGINEVRRELHANMDVTQFVGPDPVGSGALVLSTVMVVTLATYLTLGAWVAAGPFGAIPLYLLSVLAIARQQRALELLVHDASHGAISRIRWLNDLLCDVFAGAPVMQLTGLYRLTHKVHHQQFGGDLDPCRGRMFMMGESRQGWFARVRAVLGAMPSYLADYYGGVASTSWKPVAAAVCWHGAAIGLMALLMGATAAIAVWSLFWLVPFVGVLPIIRMIAESDEHDYGAGCEAAGTFTNIGVLNTLIVHPASDQFHLAHHVLSGIAMSRLRHFDRIARKVSPLYAAMPVRIR